MRKGAGKSKGSGFEREVCKLFSLWVTEGSRDDVFWRSAISGGRATVHQAKGRNLSHVSGDMCAVHPDGYPFVKKFYVECKFYRNLNLEAFLLGEQQGLLSKFWVSTKQQAQSYNKRPLLIARQNRTPTLLITDTRLVPGVRCSVGITQRAFVYYFEEVLKNVRPNLDL